MSDNSELLKEDTYQGIIIFCAALHNKYIKVLELIKQTKGG